MVANFDRGWDLQPEKDAAREVVDLLAAGIAEHNSSKLGRHQTRENTDGLQKRGMNGPPMFALLKNTQLRLSESLENQNTGRADLKSRTESIEQIIEKYQRKLDAAQ